MNKLFMRFIALFVLNRKTRDFLRHCRIGFYRNSGKNNNIYFMKHKLPFFLIISGLRITIKGNNNKIDIDGCNRDFYRCAFDIHANDSLIDLGYINFMRYVVVKIYGGKQQVFKFGDNSDCNGMEVVLGESKSCVEIGNDTIMSYGIVLRASDQHTITDVVTGDILNSSKNILHIGNHCWIGQGVKFTKNGYINNDCIVGFYSLVTKKFEESNIVLCGNPAHIVRRNVSFNLLHVDEYKNLINQKVE